MTAKFKVGDKVMVPEGAPGARSWWVGKPSIVRAVIEDAGLYEVLFQDAEDFAFVEEGLLVSLGQASPEYVEDLHNTEL